MQAVKPLRPFNPQLNPNKVYARAALGAPVPGNSYKSFKQRAQAMQSRTLFDPGTNKLLMKDVQDRYGFDDTVAKQITQAVGAVAGGALGLKKGLTLSTGIIGVTSMGGPVGTAVGAVLSTILTAGTTISGAYTGYAIGGTLSKSGLIASGELIRDVVIGMKTDFAQTASYVVIQAASTIISTQILKKFGFKEGMFQRLIANFASQTSTQTITTLTGLVDNVDPNRMNLLSLSGATQAQYTGANAIRASITGAGDDNLTSLEAVKQAYGVSEEGYRAFSFTDVRSSFGINLDIVSAQFVDFLGNTLTDPSFWNQQVMNKTKKISQDNIKDSFIKQPLSEQGAKFINELLEQDEDLKFLTKFILDNMDKLDSVETKNKFIASFFTKEAIKNNPKQINDLYLEIMGVGLDSLTIQELEMYSALKSNRETAKGFKEVAGDTSVDTELANQFASLNLSGKDLNLAAATYSMVNYFDKALINLSKVAGWADPFQKFLYGSQNKITQFMRSQKLLKRNKLAGEGIEKGLYRIDTDQVEEYINEKHTQNKAHTQALLDEREAIMQKAEIEKQKSPESTTYDKTLAEYNVVLEMIAAERKHLEELQKATRIAQQFTDDEGKVHTINESNRNVKGKELDKLRTKQNKSPEEKNYEVQLRDALESFDVYYSQRYIEADNKYRVSQLQTGNKLLKDTYDSLRAEIVLEFEGKGDDDEIIVTMPGKVRFQRDAINKLDITKEQSEELYKYFTDRKGGYNSDIISNEDMERYIGAMKNSNDDYSMPLPKRYNFASSTQYMKNLYIEEQLQNNQVLNVLRHNIQNTLNYVNEMVTELSSENYTEVFDLVEDPIERKYMQEVLYEELKKFDRGLLKDIMQGIDRVFEAEPSRFFSTETNIELQAKLDEDFLSQSVLSKIVLDPNVVEAARFEIESRRKELEKQTTQRTEVVTLLQETIRTTTDVGLKRQLRTYNGYVTNGVFSPEIIAEYNQLLDIIEGRDVATSDGQRETIDSASPEVLNRKEEIEAQMNKSIDDANKLANEIIEAGNKQGIDLSSILVNGLDVPLNMIEQEALSTEKKLQQLEKLIEDMGTVDSPINNIPIGEMKLNPEAIFEANESVNEEFVALMDMGDIYARDEFRKGATLKSIIENRAFNKVKGISQQVFTSDQKVIIDVLKGYGINLDLEEHDMVEFLSEIKNLHRIVDRFNRSQNNQPQEGEDHFTGNYTDYQQVGEDNFNDLMRQSKFAEVYKSFLGDSANSIYDFDGILLDDIEAVIDNLEPYIKKKTVNVEGNVEHTNVIKEFANYGVQIQSSSGTEDMNLLSFIYNNGSVLDKEHLYDTLRSIYDYNVGTLNTPIEDLYERTNNNPSLSDLQEFIDGTVIENKHYDSQFHKLVRIRNNVSSRFNKVKMQNNTPMYEAISTPDIMEAIYVMDDTLNYGKMVDSTTHNKVNNLNHLDELLKVNMDASPYIQKLKPKLGNFRFKADLINNFKTDHNLSEVDTLKLMDFISRVQSVDFFKYGTDSNKTEAGFFVSNNQMNYILDKAMSINRFKNMDFLLDFKLEINRMREDILQKESQGTTSAYKNRRLNQNYDRSLADGIKNTLQNQMTLYIEMKSGKNILTRDDEGNLIRQELDPTDRRLGMVNQISDKAMSIGTLTSVINGPLSRQANRNMQLMDKVFTDDFYVQNILRQDLDFKVDAEAFKAKHPDDEVPTTKEELVKYRDQQDWTTYEDNRVNASSLINEGAFGTIIRPDIRREVSYYKSKNNIYYKKDNKSVFNYGEELTEKGVMENQTLIDQRVDASLNHVFEGLYAKTAELNIKRSDIATKTLFFTSAQNFMDAGLNKQELRTALDYYEEFNEEYQFDEDVIKTLMNPVNLGYTNTLDEDVVKAAIGRTMYVMSNPILNDENLFVEYKNTNDEIKVEIAKTKERIEKLSGRFESQVSDINVIDGMEIPTYEIIYNVYQNIKDPELANEYLAEIGLEPMTPEDITFKESGQPIDYKNPTPLMRQLLNYKEIQLTKVDDLLEKAEEVHREVIAGIKRPNKIFADADSQEEIDRKIKQANIDHGMNKKAIISASEEILNFDGGETSTAYVSEWSNSDIKIKLDKAREDMILAFDLIDEERDVKIAEIDDKLVATGQIERIKYNGIKDTIMEGIKKNDPEALINELHKTYPNQKEFIDKMVTELQLKFNDKKSQVTGRRLNYTTKTIKDENGKEFTVSLPLQMVTNGYSIELLDRLLRDPRIPNDYKKKFLIGQDLEEMKKLPFFQVEKVDFDRSKLTIDKGHTEIEGSLVPNFFEAKDVFEYYSELLGSEEYGQIVANNDKSYISEVNAIEYDLGDELFELIMTLEDNMWNYGVHESDRLTLEQQQYQSDTLRANQLGNYFTASFADLTKLYTNESGVVDYDGILANFANNPHYTIVGIGTGDAKRARNTTLRETLKDDEGKATTVKTTVEATDNTPVIKELSIETKEDVAELIRLSEEGYQVGLMNETSYSAALSTSYKSFKLPKALDKAYNAFVRTHKMSAVMDNGFVPEVLTSTIMSNMMIADGVIDADTALRYGVDAFKLYNTWNQVQNERMMSMQEVLQLEHEIQSEDNERAKAQLKQIEHDLKGLAGNSEEINTLVNGFKYQNDQARVRSIYHMLNKMNNANYAETLVSQNGLFSTNENKEKRNLAGQSIALKDIDLVMLSETHKFMSINAVGQEQSKVHNAMTSFMEKNPELQVSEEHMRWLYFQNPEALHSKSFLNPNNWSTYHLSAANAINNVGMLNGYLIGKHLYGDNLEQGVARALNTHYGMKPQSKQELLTQFIFPYMNSATHNIEFWGSMFESSTFQRVTYNLMTSAWGEWNERNNKDRTNHYANRLMQQGMIPLDNNNFMKVSMHREIFKSFNLAQNPDEGMLQRMNPMLRYAIGELGVGQKQSAMSTIPFAGNAHRYVTGFNDRQGLSKYSPSLFGYMNTYQKSNFVPYRNLYKQTYSAQGKYRTPSNNALQTVKNVQYRIQERKYRR